MLLLCIQQNSFWIEIKGNSDRIIQPSILGSKQYVYTHIHTHMYVYTYIYIMDSISLSQQHVKSF